MIYSVQLCAKPKTYFRFVVIFREILNLIVCNLFHPEGQLGREVPEIQSLYVQNWKKIGSLGFQ